ncbi:MAG TPA: phosphocholine cytidylyltransferase family protein [Pyrinomonadaceae bacterium]|nr:phosphocholine cytidylyltransferase family protein [Pyrinomonadaceae bacterium]
MKAIILAAGKGTRLDGAAVKPKCLIKIGGLTLLHRQIVTLRNLDINEIIVVVGFAGDSIREECDSGVTFVENVDFAETSSLYSLWLARDYLSEGFVVLNSDVLFHPQMLTDLIKSECEDALLISNTSDESDELGDEEMKVRVEGGLVSDISKDMNPLEADGENVGIVKFGPPGAKILVSYMDELINQGAVKDWAPRAFRQFASRHPLHALSTRGLPWIEIDFPEDYQRAIEDVYPRIESLPVTWKSSFKPSRHHSVVSLDEL